MVYYRPHEQCFSRGTRQETLDSVLAFVFYSIILICHHILFHSLQFIFNPNGHAAITLAALVAVVLLFDKSMIIASGILASTEFSWKQHNNAYLSSEEVDIGHNEPTTPLTTSGKLVTLFNGLRLLCTASCMTLVNCLYNTNTNDDDENKPQNNNDPFEDTIGPNIEDQPQQGHYMVNNNFQQQLRVKSDLTLGCPRTTRQNDTEAQAFHGYDRYGDYYLNTVIYET